MLSENRESIERKRIQSSGRGSQRKERSAERGTRTNHCPSSHRRRRARETCAYAYWHTQHAPCCESCILHRARQDRHLRTGAARMSDVPVISSRSLLRQSRPCREKRSKGSGRNASRGRRRRSRGKRRPRWRERIEGSKVSNVDDHDMFTNGKCGSNVKSSAQSNFAAKEVTACCQHLGRREAAFYGDHEPTVRAILRILLNSRHALGLRTRVLPSRIRGNWLAGLTCTIMGDLMSRIQVRLNSHPLWSWAAKHSCWIVNRYQAYHGVTAFELVHGK